MNDHDTDPEIPPPRRPQPHADHRHPPTSALASEPAAPDHRLTLRYTVSVQELVDIGREWSQRVTNGHLPSSAPRLPPVSTRAFVVAAVFAGLLAALCHFIAGGLDFGITIGLFVVFFFLISFAACVSMIRAANKAAPFTAGTLDDWVLVAREEFDGEVVFTATPEFIEWSTPASSTRRLWIAVDRVEMLPSALVIRTTSRTLIPVPRSAFATDDDFRTFAHALDLWHDRDANDARRIVRYLADTDARCPSCDYSLSQIPIARCPECGLVLTRGHFPRLFS